MKSFKHKAKEPFQPFKNPTPKVRDAWSRFWTGLAIASVVGGTAILTTTDQWTLLIIWKAVTAFACCIVCQILSIRFLKGA